MWYVYYVSPYFSLIEAVTFSLQGATASTLKLYSVLYKIVNSWLVFPANIRGMKGDISIAYVGAYSRNGPFCH